MVGVKVSRTLISIRGGSPITRAHTRKVGISRPAAFAVAFVVLLGTIAAAAAPAAAAGLTVSPASVAFGNVVFGVTGETSTARSVRIINPATGQTVTGLSFRISGDTGDFTITINGCASTLAPGTNCTVMLTFSPTALGARMASLAVSDTANANARSFALSGVGIPGKLTITPLTLNFGNTVVGSTTAAKNTTVTNENTVAVHIFSVIDGDPNFAITSDSCSGTDLVPAATCAVGAVFRPYLAPGPVAGSLNFNLGNGLQESTTLKGTGILANPTVSPLSLAFGRVHVGLVSATKSVT